MPEKAGATQKLRKFWQFSCCFFKGGINEKRLEWYATTQPASSKKPRSFKFQRLHLGPYHFLSDTNWLSLGGEPTSPLSASSLPKDKSFGVWELNSTNSTSPGKPGPWNLDLDPFGYFFSQQIFLFFND